MEHISAVVYINLDRRTDRRVEFEAEMEKMGITNYIRFPAIDRSPGILGCHSSHLAVLKMAKANNWTNVLVYEDDFTFIIDKETYHDTLDNFFKLDISYDALMLSYNLEESEEYNDIVGIVRKARTASSYLVHNRYYDRLIEILENSLHLLEKTHAHWLYLNDVCWFPHQQAGGWYYMKTRCGVQRPSYSDLGETYVDYGV
jgi:GR25 family glycosyltransferase involved in LPS biosynthesis